LVAPHRFAAARHRLSWGFAALQGHGVRGLGRAWVPSNPFDVRRPSGFEPRALPTNRSLPTALLALTRPFRGRPPGIRPTRRRAPGLHRAHHFGGSFLSWTLVALRHTLSVVDLHVGDGSLHRRAPRAGFDYPLRGSPRGLATADAFPRHTPTDTSGASERPWASPFTGFPSRAMGTPLGALALLTFGAAPPPDPKVDWVRGLRLQGVVPAASPCLAGTSGGKPPSAPTADPVLGFRAPPELAPARSGSRFGRGASPHTLGWGDVPVRLGLRVSGVE